jgi:hypothetical protein
MPGSTSKMKNSPRTLAVKARMAIYPFMDGLLHV